MEVLLDTQSLLWWSIDPTRLSQKARASIRNAKKLHFSLCSFWELSIKANKEKHKLPLEAKDLEPLLKAVKCNGAMALEITPDCFFKSTSLPFHHRDPFDRLIIATAMQHQLPVVSSDRDFPKYEVPVIW
ncbi:MAG: PIN domain nuclease of toxin-antitoxin system [Paracoccaceae bacterium]|jgi:PIN domain nuclease of toxin-antitoxin system